MCYSWIQQGTWGTLSSTDRMYYTDKGAKWGRTPPWLQFISNPQTRVSHPATLITAVYWNSSSGGPDNGFTESEDGISTGHTEPFVLLNQPTKKGSSFLPVNCSKLLRVNGVAALTLEEGKPVSTAQDALGGAFESHQTQH